MHPHPLHATHQSPSLPMLPGCWKLEAGHALTLQPARAGVLRIADGRVWLTLDRLRGDVQARGDLFLAPGASLVVQAGQRAVLEPAGTDRRAPAYFSWEPLPSQAQAGAPRPRWQQAVGQPVRDFGLALGQAAAALGRLARGVAGLLGAPVRGRQTV
ncbi:DUF2917 domain-containing protein [Pseudorhodoferax sp.]|uniref:DUF2917 domain-containing protein n=1 Tax=Pseudorhodoferax sp. TaxID=1993553 RepID=UPI0039E61B15